MRAVIVPRLEGDSIGPRIESLGNWDGPIAMVPCLHQGNIYNKRKLRVWRDQKFIPLVGAIATLTCAGRQSTPSGKLGRTNGQCTMFEPRKYLYQKEATGMERPQMYSVSRCNNPT